MSDLEKAIGKARKYMKQSEAAYGKKDYVLALQCAGNSASEQAKVGDPTEFASVIKKVLDVTNKVLTVLKTNTKLHQKDFKQLLSDGQYILHVADCMTGVETNEKLMSKKKQLLSLIGDLDPLWKEERDIIRNLRESCDENGEEKASQKVSKLLHQLGNMYFKKSPDKRALVQASALYSSALARKKAGTLDIHKDIRALNRVILKAAGAKSRLHDLHEISQRISKRKLLEVREWVSKSLQALQNAENKEVSEVNVDNEYVEKIKLITSYIANEISMIMGEVSKKCTEILGEPPCKFTHFAMGSLPQERATTNCLVQTAIILDNDAKKAENYDSIVEYFRWYSVLFQVIVIYFGESPLEGVEITPNNEWTTGVFSFRDHTTKGVRCSSILDATTGSNLKFEMINTSKEMLKMVDCKTMGDDAESMYFMLSRVRYIGGSAGLLKKFQKRVRKLLYSEAELSAKFVRSILERLKGYIEPYSFKGAVLDGFSKEHPKVSYTKVIDVVDSISHMAHTDKNTVYENIDALQKGKFLSKQSATKIRFALSKALEISLRQADDYLNSESKMYEPKISIEDFMEITDKRGVVSFLLISADLQTIALGLVQSSGSVDAVKRVMSETENVCDRSEALIHFGFYDSALSCIETSTAKDIQAPSNVFIHFVKGLCLTKLNRSDEANDSFNVCLGILLTLPEADQAKIIHYAQYCIGKNMLHGNKLTQARDHLYEAKQSLEASADVGSDEGHELYIGILDAITELEYLSGDYNLAHIKCGELLDIVTQTPEKNDKLSYAVIVRSGNCLFKLGHYRQCAQEMEKTVTLHREIHEADSEHLLLPVVLKLADCYLRLNQTEEAEIYCNESLKMIKSSKDKNHDDKAYVKLMLAQCHLRQNKYRKASQGACKAFLAAFDTSEPDANRLTIIQAAVLVILRCMKPVSAKIKEEDLRVTWESASRVFDAICEQNVFKNNQLERDKSVLVRVIQKGLFDLNGYDIILECCKRYVSDYHIIDTSISLLQNLIEKLDSNDKLRDQCERDCDYLCRIAKFCNIRDSFSVFGATTIFTGWLARSCKRQSDEGTFKVMEQWLSEQDDVTRLAVLYSAVKICKHMVDSFAGKAKEGTPKSEFKCVPFLDFVRGVYDILKNQKDVPNDLLHETATLITTTASCWMKLQNHEKALGYLNDALELQEKLALNAANFAFLDSTDVIDNIGICLAKLRRWEEAKGYLKRGTAVTESRRKSRAFEDYSMLQLRVNSAKCSFSVGNFQETAFTANHAFHEGLEIDSDERREDLMMAAVALVLKSTLGVSVHSQSESAKARFPEDMVRSVLDCSITLRKTLEEHSEELGSSFTEMVESFYYACGNCHYALSEYKPAMKCFKKSLKILRRRGKFDTIEKPIVLNVAKCLVRLGKYKKAEKSLRKLLEMEKDKNLIVHLHPSHAYVLLGTCSIRRHKYKIAYRHTLDAFMFAVETDSDALKTQIAEACCNIFLQIFSFALYPNYLD